MEIVHAADVSSASKGYAFQLWAVLTSPGSGSSSIEIKGALTPQEQGTATVSLEADGQDQVIREILLGPIVYVKASPAEAAKLPGHKPWLVLNTRELPKSSPLAEEAAISSSSSPESPTTMLNYIKAESSDIRDVGRSSIGGVPTTKYLATMNLTDAGSGQSEAARAALKALLRDYNHEILNETHVPVEVWIDHADLVRKYTFVLRLLPRGTSQPIAAHYTLFMTGYGAEPVPAPPPADETLNLVQLLKAEGKLNALNG
jgi:hypothetical protein